MDDQTPQTPPRTTPETGEQKPVVQDPHLGEPAPPAPEGLRPEADPTLVRPEEDEPLGPVAGLMAASSAEVEAEYTDDSEAEELLAAMGVEDEGIEAGQIGGLAIAILVSIFALAIVVYYLFYVPFRDQTAGLSESDVRYEELELINTEGETKLAQYARADSAYSLPIGTAMGLVAAEYGGDAAGAPRTRASFNTAPLPTIGMTAGALPVADSTMTLLDDASVPAADGMQEEVGVDVPVDPDPADSGL